MDVLEESSSNTGVRAHNRWYKNRFYILSQSVPRTTIDHAVMHGMILIQLGVALLESRQHFGTRGFAVTRPNQLDEGTTHTDFFPYEQRLCK